MKMKPAVTMQDVADEAGLSRATVSLSLRGDRRIPEETRQRVAAVVRKLGYRANPLVAALMSLHRQSRPAASSSTLVIGYLTSHRSGNSWRRQSPYVDMFNGAEQRAEETGYRLEEFNLGAQGMTPVRMRDILLARNIHAVIVAPLPHRQTTIDFDFSSLAVVGLGMSVHTPVIERVANDHFQSAALAVRQCTSLGYKRIGLVLSQETSQRLDHRWLGGFNLAIEQGKLETTVPPLMTEYADDLTAAMPAWLRAHKPDVVILDNPSSDQHRQVPVTTGIVSLAVDRPTGGLSGIHQNYSRLGRVAAELVITKLYTNNFGSLDEAYLHLVAGTWVPGKTAPGPRKRRSM